MNRSNAVTRISNTHRVIRKHWRPGLALALLLLCGTAQAKRGGRYSMGVAADADPSTYAVLWAGNGAQGFAQFRRVDDKKVKQGLWSWTPDALLLPPGRHVVKFSLHKGNMYIDDERDIEMVAGHTYVLRFRDRAAGTRARINVEDLGTRTCRMDSVGSGLGAYDQLVCEGDDSAVTPTPPPGTGFH